MGKATDNLQFGRYILRVDPNKSPLKILEKRERGHIQEFPKFLGYPLLSQEWVKIRTYAHSKDQSEQKHIKIREN